MSHAQSTLERSGLIAKLLMVNIDCAVPASLARFCVGVGWEVIYSDDSYGMIGGNGIKIGFGKIDGFRPAQWPEETGAKRFHLDMQVDDLDEATDRLCKIGASQPDFQPSTGHWRVLPIPMGNCFA